MISYLNGKIILKQDKFIILEVNDVGYKVFLSKKTMEKLTENAEAGKFFCFHNIREDASDLYGFLNLSLSIIIELVSSVISSEYLIYAF